MTRFFQIIAVVCAFLFNSGPGNAEERLTVFAAASLKGALDEVVQGHAGDVAVSYGGSGLMARQVAQGAPADLVFLANTDWMDWLAAQGHPKLLNRTDLLGNTLVLVGPADAPPLAGVSAENLLTRLAGDRLAIGLTESVPAGIYGRQWLEAAGLWTILQPHLAQTDNVRAALALVSRGEVPLGVVYASDARADPNVQVLYEIPAGMHDAIVYPLAVIDNKNAAQALDLVEQLLSPKSAGIFQTHGFDTLRTRP